jgi:hypothetical protein
VIMFIDDDEADVNYILFHRRPLYLLILVEQLTTSRYAS